MRRARSTTPPSHGIRPAIRRRPRRSASGSCATIRTRRSPPRTSSGSPRSARSRAITPPPAGSTASSCAAGPTRRAGAWRCGTSPSELDLAESAGRRGAALSRLRPGRAVREGQSVHRGPGPRPRRPALRGGGEGGLRRRDLARGRHRSRREGAGLGREEAAEGALNDGAAIPHLRRAQRRRRTRRRPRGARPRAAPRPAPPRACAGGCRRPVAAAPDPTASATSATPDPAATSTTRAARPPTPSRPRSPLSGRGPRRRPTAVARQLFSEGVRLDAAGELGPAAAAFERAYDSDLELAHAGVNAAVLRERMGGSNRPGAVRAGPRREPGVRPRGPEPRPAPIAGATSPRRRRRPAPAWSGLPRRGRC